MKITPPPSVWSKEPFDPNRDYKPGDSFLNEHGEHVLVVPEEEMKAMFAMLHGSEVVETRLGGETADQSRTTEGQS